MKRSRVDFEKYAKLAEEDPQLERSVRIRRDEEDGCSHTSCYVKEGVSYFIEREHREHYSIVTLWREVNLAKTPPTLVWRDYVLDGVDLDFGYHAWIIESKLQCKRFESVRSRFIAPMGI